MDAMCAGRVASIGGIPKLLHHLQILLLHRKALLVLTVGPLLVHLQLVRRSLGSALLDELHELGCAQVVRRLHAGLGPLQRLDAAREVVDGLGELRRLGLLDGNALSTVLVHVHRHLLEERRGLVVLREQLLGNGKVAELRVLQDQELLRKGLPTLGHEHAQEQARLLCIPLMHQGLLLLRQGLGEICHARLSSIELLERERGVLRGGRLAQGVPQALEEEPHGGRDRRVGEAALLLCAEHAIESRSYVFQLRVKFGHLGCARRHGAQLQGIGRQPHGGDEHEDREGGAEELHCKQG
mmetsp:Transcript_5618/g.21263  ORF Transcript_5618/g.21263 Transcript_5618/m.21263 type:complete len:297 (-) Transcript_5618:24-914(-)